MGLLAPLPRTTSVATKHTSNRGGPISPEPRITEPRINDRIRVPEVRLVGPAGEQVGIVKIEDALRLAQDSDLDLVEVAAQKARESRRNQQFTVIKEQKLRPKIDSHDYETKKGHVARFLSHGNKVKVTIMFRGREQSRPELGSRLLQRLADDVAELGFVEASPKLDGRNMIMVLAPHKNLQKPQVPKARAGSADAGPEGAEELTATAETVEGQQ